MEPEFLPCPTCGEITLAEVPPCDDEHGIDCSDRACTRCGTGLTVAGHPSWDELAAAANAPARGSTSTRAPTPGRRVPERRSRSAA